MLSTIKRLSALGFANRCDSVIFSVLLAAPAGTPPRPRQRVPREAGLESPRGHHRLAQAPDQVFLG